MFKQSCTAAPSDASWHTSSSSQSHTPPYSETLHTSLENVQSSIACHWAATDKLKKKRATQFALIIQFTLSPCSANFTLVKLQAGLSTFHSFNIWQDRRVGWHVVIYATFVCFFRWNGATSLFVYFPAVLGVLAHLYIYCKAEQYYLSTGSVQH